MKFIHKMKENKNLISIGLKIIQKSSKNLKTLMILRFYAAIHLSVLR